MGKIELDHTGSGGGITLSSDGTDLLLNGTAVGGGGGATGTDYDDDVKVRFGTGNDLEIYHDGTTNHSYIKETNSSGHLNIQGQEINFKNAAGTTLLNMNIAQVELRQSGNKKLETTPTGIQTTGTVNVNGAYTLPTSDGTNGQVLTTDGAGNVTFATASGGGGSPDLYADNYDGTSTTPNASATNSVAIGKNSVSGGGSSIAFGASASSGGNLSSALGFNATVGSSGSFSAAIGQAYSNGSDAFAAAIANNSSSYGALGNNSVAIGYQAKATGTAAYALGRLSSASGNYSVCLGNSAYTTSNAQFATALGSSYVDSYNSLGFGSGSQTYNGHDYSIVLGRGAKSRTKGGVYFGGGQCFFAGQNQAGIYILGSDTTDATAEALTTNNSTPSTDNQIVLPNNSVYSFHGTVVARQDATDGSACAAWEVKGLIRREGSASTTTLVNSAITVIDNTPSWGLALSADTTNGCLKVQATGAASTNIKFLATVHTTELTYN